MDNECLTRLTEQSTLKTLLVKDASGETHEGQFGSICQNSKYYPSTSNYPVVKSSK